MREMMVYSFYNMTMAIIGWCLYAGLEYIDSPSFHLRNQCIPLKRTDYRALSGNGLCCGRCVGPTPGYCAIEYSYYHIRKKNNLWS